jgi:undecaprenyl-diphosphatase
MNIVSHQLIEQLTQVVPAVPLWIMIADYSEPFFIAVLVVLWGVFLARRQKVLWTVPAHITLGLAIAVPISVTLRQLIGQTRPFADGEFAPLILHEPDFGFPSNHAVATAVFTVVFLWFGYRAIGLGLAGLTILIGVSRVVTGIHYPMDILAGWGLGAGVSVTVCYYQAARLNWWCPGIIQQFLGLTETESV